MSYAAAIPSAPIARRTIPVLAVMLHVVALWFLVWSRVVHLPPPPSQPASMEVELGELAPSADEPSPPVQKVEPTPEPTPEPEPAPEPEPTPEPEPAPEPVVVAPPIELPKPPPEVKPLDLPKPPPEVKPLDLPKPPPEVKPLDLPKPPPKEVKPLDQPKPAVTPSPKPVVKQPEPKKSRVNSADDIRKRNDLQPAKSSPRPAPVDVNRLANSLRAAAASVSVSPTTSSSNSASSASPSQARDYNAALAAAMRTYWSEDFNASELSGSGRSALVQFVIRSDGTIASARIIRRSNVGAIDARAARAIQSVRSFPPPSDYGIRSTTYSVEFELTAKD